MPKAGRCISSPIRRSGSSGQGGRLKGRSDQKGINILTAFGLLAVTAMLVTYALEDRSPWFILAFAAACVLGSIYGFLQGAWPFGLIEAIWALVAARRWWLKYRGSAA